MTTTLSEAAAEPIVSNNKRSEDRARTDRTRMKEAVWKGLVGSLQVGQCVLVLGPEVPGISVGSDGAQSARPTRDIFCEELIRQLADEQQQVSEPSPFAVAQQYDDTPALSTLNVRNQAAAFYRNLTCQPSPLHHALTELPFGLVLTTSHDNLMEQAFQKRQIQVSRHWYNFRGEPKENPAIDSPATPASPVVYHLFGASDEPNSMVLTENDILDFLIHVISERPQLPDSLKLLARNKTFLFFGFGIQYWYARVLVKLLVRALEVASGSVALETFADLDEREREHTVLFYKRGSRIEVVSMAATDFVGLAERLKASGGHVGPGKASARRPSVFISYERQDEDMARRFLGELPADKLDPWLDTKHLEAGQDWNAELEQRIAETDYAVVLNSQNLAGKKVGYVNKELTALLGRQEYRTIVSKPSSNSSSRGHRGCCLSHTSIIPDSPGPAYLPRPLAESGIESARRA